MIDIKQAKLRLLQMHYEAGVGHIGGNLSCLEILYALAEVLDYPKKDELVISKGHAAGAVYIMNWARGVYSEERLATFHKDGTKLAGHLNNTGSLGHGLGLAAGMALHKKLWKEPGIVYCLMSDGEWDEGSNWEALEFIEIQELWYKLKIIVDSNGWQGYKSGPQNLFTRFEMYDPSSCDGHEIENIVSTMKYSELILARTIKGNGVSFLEDKLASHYDPLTKEQYELACKEIENA